MAVKDRGEAAAAMSAPQPGVEDERDVMCEVVLTYRRMGRLSYSGGWKNGIWPRS